MAKRSISLNHAKCAVDLIWVQIPIYTIVDEDLIRRAAHAAAQSSSENARWELHPNQIYLYALGLAAQRTGVDLIYAMVMSNHELCGAPHK